MGTIADEALVAVHIQFLSSLYYTGRINHVENSNLRATRELLPILVLQLAEPVGSIFHQISQQAVNLLNIALHPGDSFLSLVGVELQDSSHLDFKQFQDILLGYLTNHIRIKWRQSVINMLASGIDALRLLKLTVLIDSLLNENLFQRREMQLFKNLVLTDFQLTLQQFLGIIYRTAEHIAHGEELRLLIVDHAAVGRDADLTISESIECVNGLI